MRKVGITGASGFVGQNLTAHLEQNGFCVSRFKGRITDPRDFQSVADCQDLIHLAGLNKGTDSEILRVNVLGTFNAIQHCLFHKTRLFVAGSIKRTGIYGASKGICEDMVKRMRFAGLHGSYLSLAGIYGPHAKPFYNSFPTTIMHCIAQDKDFNPLVSCWNSQMRLIHVNDVCGNIENILRHHDLNIVSDEYGPESHSMNFWHTGEFNITIQDFARIAKGEKPLGHVSERNTHLIQQTAKWYKENVSETHG